MDAELRLVRILCLWILQLVARRTAFWDLFFCAFR
jgi:hypothetical protein